MQASDMIVDGVTTPAMKYHYLCQQSLVLRSGFYSSGGVSMVTLKCSNIASAGKGWKKPIIRKKKTNAETAPMALESHLWLPWGHKSTHYDWLQAIPALDVIRSKAIEIHRKCCEAWKTPSLSSVVGWNIGILPHISILWNSSDLQSKSNGFLTKPLWVNPLLWILMRSNSLHRTVSFSSCPALSPDRCVSSHPALGTAMSHEAVQTDAERGWRWQLAFSPLSENYLGRIEWVLSIQYNAILQSTAFTAWYDFVVSD